MTAMSTCFGNAPYRFEPTNNSPEREMSVKEDDSPVPWRQCRAVLSVQVEVEVGGSDTYIVVSR